MSPPISQFTWARNPKWSRFYSSSEEIWQYFKDVATKYDLEKYVKFDTIVESATWNDEEGVWHLSILGPDGSHYEDTCDILVNGSGVLKSVSSSESTNTGVDSTKNNANRASSSWKYPKIPGLDLYKGKLMHSARWDAKYDLTGKTVAVIGGGSSAVQIVPSIQPSESHLALRPTGSATQSDMVSTKLSEN